MEPIEIKDLSDLLNELVSVQSSLNMEAYPIPKQDLEETDIFLADTDYNVKHAMDHLSNCANYVIHTINEIKHNVIEGKK